MNAVESQRRAALLLANEVRTAKAATKRELRERKIGLDEAWDRACVSSMPTGDLLLCMPKFGRQKVDKLLRRCGVSWGRPVGSLTERERLCLLAAVGGSLPYARPGSDVGVAA